MVYFRYMTNKTTNLDTLRETLLDLYDAMSEAESAAMQARHRCESGQGTYDDERAATTAYYDARSAMHSALCGIGR